MPSRTYIVRDEDRLNLDFYQRYDENYLFNKADTLFCISEERQTFRTMIESMGRETESLTDKYFDALRAEIHFTELHQFECLFALMIAVFQELPHWLYLTTYSTREIKDAVRKYLDGDIDGLTRGSHADEHSLLNHSIYTKMVVTEPDKKENWHKNLDNISWILKRIARKYIEGQEYNAYKHGLRVMTGKCALYIHPDNEPEKATCLGSTDDSLTYLELKDVSEGGETVYSTTKFINPLESINHLYVMKAMLETIKATRSAILNKLSGAKLNTFMEIDKVKFLELRTITKTSFTV
ncbi:MAG: hypothetical protein HZA22_04465 [Nitrospirae bacterium]|nr:hypothetical protein [Nitrospirota bacterium]